MKVKSIVNRVMSPVSFLTLILCLVGCGSYRFTNCLDDEEGKDMLAAAGLSTCADSAESCETVDYPYSVTTKVVYVCAFYHPESGCAGTTEQGCNTMARMQYEDWSYMCHPEGGGEPVPQHCVRFLQDDLPEFDDTKVSCTTPEGLQTSVPQLTYDVPCVDPPTSDPSGSED